jgi:hypothetical protein
MSIVVDELARLENTIRRAASPLGALAARLQSVDANALSADEWLRVRADIGNLVADFNDRVSDVDRLLGTTGAQGRILRYLLLRRGEVVTKDELSGVGGISEWARRIRELRADHGWPIHSAVTRDGLRVGEYLLETDKPDENLVRDWHAARRIRKLRTLGGEMPPKQRLLEYLKAIYPRASDKERIDFVIGSSRKRALYIEQLRAEGWPIAGATGEPSLVPGEFRLLASRPGAAERLPTE